MLPLYNTFKIFQLTFQASIVLSQCIQFTLQDFNCFFQFKHPCQNFSVRAACHVSLVLKTGWWGTAWLAMVGTIVHGSECLIITAMVGMGRIRWGKTWLLWWEILVMNTINYEQSMLMFNLYFLKLEC